jgi:hypothetical protein
LIADITGWDGVVREEFRRLARTWHGLDAKPQTQLGKFTRTPLGGYADLRRQRGSELAGGPFDEYCHTADVRLQRGLDGIYNLAKLAFYLYRLHAYPVTAVRSVAAGQNGLAFTFDPSGRDVPLFSRRDRAEKYNWDEWNTALEWQLPAPIRCRVLGDAEARDALIPDSIRVPGVATSQIVSGSLKNWNAAAPGKELVIDPERGRMLFMGALPPAEAPLVDYWYGFSAAIGAGSYRRAGLASLLTVTRKNGNPIAAPDIPQGSANAMGVLELGDNSTFTTVADRAGILNTQIQAHDPSRPYIRLQADWTLDSSPNTNALLTLDGLWIGAGTNASLILAGDYQTVTIRRATLDPGDAVLSAVPLVITGHIDTLVIDHAIAGPIVLKGGSLRQLQVSDSILQSIASGVPAIDLPDSTVIMRRATVFGEVKADRLDASETLFTGLVTITDTQALCFRFCAAPAGSRIPHPYESHVIDYLQHYFTATDFGRPGYAQLSESAPAELLTGAENSSEIGAFSSLLNPILLESMRAKVDEYMPFGLIPAFVFET